MRSSSSAVVSVSRSACIRAIHCRNSVSSINPLPEEGVERRRLLRETSDARRQEDINEHKQTAARVTHSSIQSERKLIKSLIFYSWLELEAVRRGSKTKFAKIQKEGKSNFRSNFPSFLITEQEKIVPPTHSQKYSMASAGGAKGIERSVCRSGIIVCSSWVTT